MLKGGVRDGRGCRDFVECSCRGEGEPVMTAMTADFTAEQEMLRRTTRTFAQQVVAPLAREIDRDQRFPSESWAQGAQLGILGLCAPEEFGGAGLGLTEMCIVGEELSAVCVSTAATLLHQADLVIGRLVRHGSAEQKRRWLPPMCDGSTIGDYRTRRGL